MINDEQQNGMDPQNAGYLCVKLTALLRQECPALSKSLKGDVFDAYRRLVQKEMDSVWEIRKRLLLIQDE